MNKNTFIEYYAEQANKGEISLFLGAGISSSAGYPSWKVLLEPCAKKLKININNTIDLFLLAQYYANEFGYNALKQIINENINRLNYDSDIVNELLNIDFKTIWTTNYDEVIEKNLSNRQVLTNVIYTDEDLANTSSFNRVNIIKLNGDITNLKKIVITQKDLEEYEEQHTLLLTFFKRELVVNTFLFLGYSFTDSIVLSCLSTVNKCLGSEANHHFAILKNEKTPEFEHFLKDLENRYYIRVLLVEDYDEIPIILKELNKEIKKKNIFFSGVFERLPHSDDILAEKLCKLLTSTILRKGYKIYTGYGRNFGNYLAGSSIQYLLSENLQIEKQLIMRPFLKTMTQEQKRVHREMLINDCPVAIFMYGQSPKDNRYVNSTGMLKEFEIAKKMNKYIIPVGCTKYSAYTIWEEVKTNITYYPYLERYIDTLNEPNEERITNTIIQILSEIDGSEY